MRMGKTFPHFPTRLHCLALVPNANLSSEGCVLATGINWHHRRRLSQVAELVAKMTAEEKVAVHQLRQVGGRATHTQHTSSASLVLACGPDPRLGVGSAACSLMGMDAP